MKPDNQEKKPFLKKGTSLMSLVNPQIPIPNDLRDFVQNDIKTSKKRSRGVFFELILEEDLYLVERQLDQGRLSSCVCRIPVLDDMKVESVNKAHHELLKKFIPGEINTRNVFNKVYCKATDNYWHPLKWHRDQVDSGSTEISRFKSFIKRIIQEKRSDQITQFIDLFIEDISLDVVSDLFSEMTAKNFQKMSTLIGISQLRKAINFWQENQNNCNEECWQSFLKNNPYIVSQVFLSPILILEEKAYVGGKGIGNTEGNLLDFLFIHGLNGNATLIEIKTPTMPIVGSEYRKGVYSISRDLSGSINQVLNYKDSLTKEYNSLARNSSSKLQVFNPMCVIIAGCISSLKNERELRSFELFRNTVKDVQILTYDELFKKVEMLLNLLEGIEESQSQQETH